MSWNNNSLSDIHEGASEDGEIDEEEGEIVARDSNPPPPVMMPSQSAPFGQHNPPQDMTSHTTNNNSFQGPGHIPPQRPPPPALSRRPSWQGRGVGFDAGRGGRNFRGGGGRLGHRRHSFGNIEHNSARPHPPLPPPGRSQSFSAVPVPVLSHQQPPALQMGPQQPGPPLPPQIHRPTDPRFRGGHSGNTSVSNHHVPSTGSLSTRPATMALSQNEAVPTFHAPSTAEPQVSSYSSLLERNRNNERSNEGEIAADPFAGGGEYAGSGAQAMGAAARSTSFGNAQAGKDAFPRLPHQQQNRRPSSNSTYGPEPMSYYGPSNAGAPARLNSNDHGPDRALPNPGGQPSFYRPPGGPGGPSRPTNARGPFAASANEPSSSASYYGPLGDGRTVIPEQERTPFGGVPPPPGPRVDPRGLPFSGNQHQHDQQDRPLSFPEQQRQGFDEQRNIQHQRESGHPFGPKQMDQQDRTYGPQKPDSRIDNDGNRVFGPQQDPRERQFGQPPQQQLPPQERSFGFRKPPPVQDSSPRGNAQGFQQRDGGFQRREWTPRASPHSSPFVRKNVIQMPQQANAPPPPPLGSPRSSEKQDATSVGHDSSLPIEPPTEASTQLVLKDEDLTNKIPSSLPTSATSAVASAPAAVPQPTLTTDSFGDPLTLERAESAIQILSDLVDNPALKASPGLTVNPHSELPSKHILFHALAKIDTTVKAVQQDITAKKTEIEQSERLMDDELVQAQQQAKQMVMDEEKERVALVETTRMAAEEEEDRSLEGKIRLAKSSLDTDWSHELEELDKQIALCKQEESARQEDMTTAQVIAAADLLDKDIMKARRELERIAHLMRKTEAKIVDVESTIQAKAETNSELKDADDSASSNMSSLISNVLADNQRRAAESHMQLAMLFAHSDSEGEEDSQQRRAETCLDPKLGLSNAEWALKARQVTGLGDALYSEPCEAPYYEAHEKTHAEIAPLVKEFIRHKHAMLTTHWSNLATEYEIRRKAHDEHLKKLNAGKTTQQRTSNIIRHSIFSKPGLPILESQGGRTSSNPYRRARRGNEVRSEYEQEQIIAELAAKEAYEKKITHGGSQLPRQVGPMERSLTATFYNTFVAQKVDVIEQEADLALQDTWTDLEKCIYLDRFMQHPKDFRKIAMFLRNKNTNDCVKFYYDSKPYVPYKAALMEFVMRRKKKESVSWDATIDAAISCGAVVIAGDSEEKPLVFLLPETNDYNTFLFHPMKREILDSLNEESAFAVMEDESEDDAPRHTGKLKRKPHIPLFYLEAKQRKFLKETSQDQLKVSLSRGSLAETDMTGDSNSLGDAYDDKAEKTLTPLRRPPQKWTDEEKNLFVETLAKHGRDWNLLARAVGTKSTSQIKNFYYDFKKQSGKLRPERDKKARIDGRKRKREQDTESPSLQVLGSDNSESDLQAVFLQADDSTAPLHRIASLQVQQSGLGTEEQLRMLDDQASGHQLGPGVVDNFSASELWLQQLQQQQQLERQASLLSAGTDETTRQLLQRHTSQSQQRQQLLQNLLPWNNHAPVHQTASLLDYLGDTSQLSTSQQLQALLQLEQQHQQQHRQHNPLAALSAGGHLGSSLTGLNNLNPSLLELALAQQQLQQQPQQLTPEELALQQLLGLGESSDALALLRRALNNNRQN